MPEVCNAKQAFSFSGKFQYGNKFLGNAPCQVSFYPLNEFGERMKPMAFKTEVAKGQQGLLEYYVEVRAPIRRLGKYEVEIMFNVPAVDFDPRTYDPKTSELPVFTWVPGAISTTRVVGSE